MSFVQPRPGSTAPIVTPGGKVLPPPPGMPQPVAAPPGFAGQYVPPQVMPPRPGGSPMENPGAKVPMQRPPMTGRPGGSPVPNPGMPQQSVEVPYRPVMQPQPGMPRGQMDPQTVVALRHLQRGRHGQPPQAMP